MQLKHNCQNVRYTHGQWNSLQAWSLNRRAYGLEIRPDLAVRFQPPKYWYYWLQNRSSTWLTSAPVTVTPANLRFRNFRPTMDHPVRTRRACAYVRGLIIRAYTTRARAHISDWTLLPISRAVVSNDCSLPIYTITVAKPREQSVHFHTLLFIDAIVGRVRVGHLDKILLQHAVITRS